MAHAQANLIKVTEQRGYAQIKADFAGVVTAVGLGAALLVGGGIAGYEYLSREPTSLRGF